MPRRLFTIAAVLSFLLCVATIVLWWRSYTGADAINLRWSNGEATPGTVTGGFVFSAVLHPAALRSAGLKMRAGRTKAPENFEYLRNYFASLNLDVWHEYAGFTFLNYMQPHGTRLVLLALPSWFVLTLASLLPATWLRFHFKRRGKSQEVECPGCSYNLTGNTSGVCPECGAAIGSSPMPTEESGFSN